MKNFLPLIVFKASRKKNDYKVIGLHIMGGGRRIIQEWGRFTATPQIKKKYNNVHIFYLMRLSFFKQKKIYLVWKIKGLMLSKKMLAYYFFMTFFYIPLLIKHKISYF